LLLLADLAEALQKGHSGFSMLAGMDTGDVDVSIDGGEYRTVSLFDHYCTMFYRPKIVLFADDLI
jgi:acyl-CoA thioesterase-1